MILIHDGRARAAVPVPEARELSDMAAAVAIADYFAPTRSALAERLAGDLELQQTEDEAFREKVLQVLGAAR